MIIQEEPPLLLNKPQLFVRAFPHPSSDMFEPPNNVYTDIIWSGACHVYKKMLYCHGKYIDEKGEENAD